MTRKKKTRHLLSLKTLLLPTVALSTIWYIFSIAHEILDIETNSINQPDVPKLVDLVDVLENESRDLLECFY